MPPLQGAVRGAGPGHGDAHLGRQRTALEVLAAVCDDEDVLEALRRLVHPGQQLPHAQGTAARHLQLRLQQGQQLVVLGQVALDGGAQTLMQEAGHGGCLYVLVDLAEQPPHFTDLAAVRT